MNSDRLWPGATRRNSDERLRSLERRWLADSGDLEAQDAFFSELERVGRGAEIEQLRREIERRKPPLPVVIRAWEDPREQRRRLGPRESVRLWLRPSPNDLDQAETVLRAAGARILPRSREWGELHRRETVIFSGLDAGDALDALAQAGIFVAGAHPKTWGGDALSEHRRPPSLILLFPTEFCAPPDECDSIMWQEERGQWGLDGSGCANYSSVVGRTRPATPDELAPAVAAYEVQFGRRLRIYARSSYEFDQARQRKGREAY